MPERSRRVVLLAHCHLNVNTKVHGLACYPGVRVEVVAPYVERGHGLVQLPCPEATYLGMRRWGMTREQYDTPGYRRHCAVLAQPVVDTVRLLAEDGCAVECVLGVDGSPSCGVNHTCLGYMGGEIEGALDGDIPRARTAPGFGVFMEVLRSHLVQAGVSVEFRGVEE